MILSTTQTSPASTLTLATPTLPLTPMKFLLKVAVLAAAAKFVLHTPQNANRHLDEVSNLSMRDIAHHVDTVFAKIEATIKSVLS